MGTVTKLSNLILRLAESYEEFKSVLSENACWNEYVELELTEQNRVEGLSIGGAKP
jgi:hypothetical protein